MTGRITVNSEDHNQDAMQQQSEQRAYFIWSAKSDGMKRAIRTSPSPRPFQVTAPSYIKYKQQMLTRCS